MSCEICASGLVCFFEVSYNHVSVFLVKGLDLGEFEACTELKIKMNLKFLNRKMMRVFFFFSPSFSDWQVYPPYILITLEEGTEPHEVAASAD